MGAINYVSKTGTLLAQMFIVFAFTFQIRKVYVQNGKVRKHLHISENALTLTKNIFWFRHLFKTGLGRILDYCIKKLFLHSNIGLIAFGRSGSQYPKVYEKWLIYCPIGQVFNQYFLIGQVAVGFSNFPVQAISSTVYRLKIRIWKRGWKHKLVSLRNADYF